MPVITFRVEASRLTATLDELPAAVRAAIERALGPWRMGSRPTRGRSRRRIFATSARSRGNIWRRSTAGLSSGASGSAALCGAAPSRAPARVRHADSASRQSSERRRRARVRCRRPARRQVHRRAASSRPIRQSSPPSLRTRRISATRSRARSNRRCADGDARGGDSGAVRQADRGLRVRGDDAAHYVAEHDGGARRAGARDRDGL